MMRLTKLSATNFTSIGFLPSVHSHMHLESSSPWKTLWAHRADVGPLSSMPFHMFIINSGLREGLRAHRAPIGSLACVDPLVTIHIRPIVEESTAEATLIGLLASVYSSVLLEVALNTELLATVIALIGTSTAAGWTVGDWITTYFILSSWCCCGIGWGGGVSGGADSGDRSRIGCLEKSDTRLCGECVEGGSLMLLGLVVIVVTANSLETGIEIGFQVGAF